MSAWTCRSSDGKAAPKIVPPRLRIPYWRVLGADSEEKREPVSDIDTAEVDSLKALDPNRPIREATNAPQQNDAMCQKRTLLRVRGKSALGHRQTFRRHALDISAEHPSTKNLGTLAGILSSKRYCQPSGGRIATACGGPHQRAWV